MIRLDKYLCEMEVGTRSQVKDIIKKGQVSVNGKVVRASYDVKVDDVIEITFDTRSIKVKVVSVAETVRKEDASSMYTSV